ncbi:MAG: hypothetical protein N2B03_05605, partial [Boseongicola sp.]
MGYERRRKWVERVVWQRLQQATINAASKAELFSSNRVFVGKDKRHHPGSFLGRLILGKARFEREPKPFLPRFQRL